MKRLVAIGVASLMGVLLSCMSTVSAAPGLGVTPTIEQVVFEPSQPSATFTATITNTTGHAATITVAAVDFDSVDASGAIQFSATGSKTSHGLSSAVVVAPSIYVVPDGASASVPVTILNSAALATGGHYTAIVYRVADTVAKSATVTLYPGVATLIFASTTGKGTQQLRLHTPVMDSLVTSWPSSLSLVLANNGDVQTTPRGVVQLLDPGGTVVTQTQLNVDSGLILPGSQRLFSVSLLAPSSAWLPHVYDLRVSYHYEGQATQTLYMQRILYLPADFIVGVSGVVILAAVTGMLMLRHRRSMR